MAAILALRFLQSFGSIFCHVLQALVIPTEARHLMVSCSLHFYVSDLYNGLYLVQIEPFWMSESYSFLWE